jgi:hypothetical protein
LRGEGTFPTQCTAQEHSHSTTKRPSPRRGHAGPGSSHAPSSLSSRGAPLRRGRLAVGTALALRRWHATCLANDVPFAKRISLARHLLREAGLRPFKKNNFHANLHLVLRVPVQALQEPTHGFTRKYTLTLGLAYASASCYHWQHVARSYQPRPAVCPSTRVRGERTPQGPRPGGFRQHFSRQV